MYPLKQKSKSRSSSRSKSSSMRKRVSFDETPVEISREPSGSKLNQNGLVPNGIHLNHHTMGQKYKNVFSTILKIWYKIITKKKLFQKFQIWIHFYFENRKLRLTSTEFLNYLLLKSVPIVCKSGNLHLNESLCLKCFQFRFLIIQTFRQILLMLKTY